MNERIGYFGFGSLVNRKTLRTKYLDAIPTRLLGWKRHWQGRQKVGDRNVALLSIHRDTTSAIQGLMIVDELKNLPEVDQREIGYDRVQIQREDLEWMEPGTNDNQLPDQLFVYVGKKPATSSQKSALLQSYTDAVMQGFFNEYGFPGVEHFVETTIGFDRPMIADRGDPRYPRAIKLTSNQAEVFDQILKSAGVSFQI